MVTTLLLILLCIVLSAFFSGMEIAFISANRMHLELYKKKDTYTSKALDYLLTRPKQFIVTMLVGNNIVLVIYGILMEDIFSEPIEKLLSNSSTGLVLFTQTILSTIIILFLGEFIPKAIFRNYALESLHNFSIPAFMVEKILSPLNWGIMHISSLFLSLTGNTEAKESPIDPKDELKFLLSEHIEEAEEETIDTEIQIFHNALTFSDKKVRECMIPRNEICGVEINDSIETLKKEFTQTGYSKILIYREKIDNIIGYAHSYEIFKRPSSIRSVLLPVEFVPETMAVRDVMNVLIQKRKSIAVVLDEYGGTAGLVTMEDIIEELFGEIEDEHDKELLLEEVLSPDEYLFSARLEIDYLNEKYGLNLPTQESYETLGGLFSSYYGDIPVAGAEIMLDHLILQVKKASETKAEEVYIKVLKD